MYVDPNDPYAPGYAQSKPAQGEDGPGYLSTDPNFGLNQPGTNDVIDHQLDGPTGAPTLAQPHPFQSYGQFQPYTPQTWGGHFAAPQMPSDLMDPWTERFTAPTEEDARQDPGYLFRAAEGQKALQRSAAARGTLLTGGTLKGLNDWAQQNASQEYQNVYGRRFGEYTTAFNQFETDKMRRAQTYGDIYNRAFGEYTNNEGQFNLGQQFAYTANLGNQQAQFQREQGNNADYLNFLNAGNNATLGSFGMGLQNQQFGLQQSQFGEQQHQNQANNLLNLMNFSNPYGYAQLSGQYGGQLADLYTQQGNARAAGTVGSSNAWGNTLGNIGNNINQATIAAQLRGNGYDGGGRPYTPQNNPYILYG